jgi:hypothetical protein
MSTFAEEILMRTWSSVRQAVAATCLLVLTSAAMTSLSSTPAYANLCPLTQGFWKNHTIPVGLSLGGQFYTPAQLKSILQTPPAGGNAALILAHQLIAADLNIATGSTGFPISPSIDALIIIANASLSSPVGCGTTRLPPVGGCFVQGSTPNGQAMVAFAGILDSFNSGALTPSCIPRLG